MLPSLSPVCPQPTRRLAPAILCHPLLLQPTLYSPWVVLTLRFLSSDDTFADLADGKLESQKAFMTGKLKTKGNMMLATRLGPLLAIGKPKAKL